MLLAITRLLKIDSSFLRVGTDGSGRALLQTILAAGQTGRQTTSLVIEELADFYLTEVPNVGLQRQHLQQALKHVERLGWRFGRSSARDTSLNAGYRVQFHVLLNKLDEGRLPIMLSNMPKLNNLTIEIHLPGELPVEVFPDLDKLMATIIGRIWYGLDYNASRRVQIS
jgi:hypothetical protein